MEFLFDVLKITVPAGLVLWGTYNTMSRFLEKEKEEKRLKRNETSKKTILPLQLKAYERLTLFLERISPENIIQRSQKNNMTCSELQMALLKTIRMEYEHNLAQQIYVSDEAWESVFLAKESINQLVNASMASVPPHVPAIELAKRIIEAYHNSDTTPTEEAIKTLKLEVKELFLF